MYEMKPICVNGRDLQKKKTNHRKVAQKLARRNKRRRTD